MQYIYNSFAKILVCSILILHNYNVSANQLPENIESYIKNIKSIAVDFQQVDSAGNKAHGTLIIDKPYKFRCHYYTPFPLLIVGNKNYVSVLDYEMEHLSRIDAKENIFYFLLVDKINFKNQFEILSTKEVDNLFILRIRAVGLDKISEIHFDKKTKQLKLMKIIEDNNIITLKFGTTHQIYSPVKSLFLLRDPDIFGLPKRINHQELFEKVKMIK